MQRRDFWVYILASKTRRLYVGVTGDLARRMSQHKSGAIPGFARRYGMNRLVYVETAASARDAIAREKQIKGWLRCKKLALIQCQNPGWIDRSEEWFGLVPGRSFASLRMTIHTSRRQP
jgi:putative endonuclease